MTQNIQTDNKHILGDNAVISTPVKINSEIKIPIDDINKLTDYFAKPISEVIFLSNLDKKKVKAVRKVVLTEVLVFSPIIVGVTLLSVFHKSVIVTIFSILAIVVGCATAFFGQLVMGEIYCKSKENTDCDFSQKLKLIRDKQNLLNKRLNPEKKSVEHSQKRKMKLSKIIKEKGRGGQVLK